jgi:hypothetical protein
VNLDTNRRVAKINLVASPVLSSNDGMGHGIWLSEINGVGCRSGCHRANRERSMKFSGRYPPSRGRPRTGVRLGCAPDCQRQLRPRVRRE